MQTRRRTSSNIKLVLVTLITTIIALILSLSRYQTTRASSDSASVAAPILNTTSDIITVAIDPVVRVKWVWV